MKWKYVNRILTIILTGVFSWLLLPAIGMSEPMVFPGTVWEERKPESQGVDGRKLQQALEYLESRCDTVGIRKVAVIRNGYLIWKGVESRTRVGSIASVGKVFTSTVLGLLIDEGRCTLDTRAEQIEPLLKDLYPEVTLRHFATMTSGYDAEGRYPSSRHLNRDSDTGDWGPDPYAVAPPLFAPGTAYCYYDEAMFMLGRILTRITGQTLHSYLDARIAGSIGIGDWTWYSEGLAGTVDGIPINWGPGNVGITAEQLARLGHLFLNVGCWDGRQLISREWVEQATLNQVPLSLELVVDDRYADGRGVYGYHWWTNGLKADGTRNLPDAPPGTFYRTGANHNMLFVIPEWNMVVVRLGRDNNPEDRIAVWNKTLGMIGAAVTREGQGAGR